jgi:hypothetical protein
MHPIELAWESISKLARVSIPEEDYNLHGEAMRLPTYDEIMQPDPALNIREHDEIGLEGAGTLGGQYDEGLRYLTGAYNQPLDPKTIRQLRARWGTVKPLTMGPDADPNWRAYAMKPHVRQGTGPSDIPSDAFQTPSGPAHTVPQRTEGLPTARERMTTSKPLEEELPLIEEYGSRHPSTYTRGPDEEGHQPRDWGGWNAERINQIANYARNVFDALFQWNPSWGRPPDLPPHASPEDVNDWYRQAAQMKADWEEEHGEELRPPSPEELEAINDPKHGWLAGEGRQWDDEERGYRSKLRRQGSDDWDTRLVDPARIKEYMAHLDSLREQGLLTTQKRVGVQAPAGGSQGRRSQQKRQRRRFRTEWHTPPQPQPPGGDDVETGEPIDWAWSSLMKWYRQGWDDENCKRCGEPMVEDVEGRLICPKCDRE